MKYQWMLLGAISLTGCVTVTESDNHDVKSDPVEMAESRIALGLGYLDNGRMIKARENLEKALQHAPHYYRAQLSMAHYFEIVDETDAARRCAIIRRTGMCSIITGHFCASMANINKPTPTSTALSNSPTTI